MLNVLRAKIPYFGLKMMAVSASAPAQTSILITMEIPTIEYVNLADPIASNVKVLMDAHNVLMYK